MDLSQEEIEKIWAAKTDAHERMVQRNNRHQQFLKLFESGQLKDVIPIWHTKIEEIDLSKQRDNLCDDLLENGFSIIENVDMELLLDKMIPGNPAMFREKILYNEDLIDLRITEVLDKWINGVKLIPPTILVIDKAVGKMVNDTDELFPADGKHRLNVAYFYGVKSIPIFVVNKQLEKIKKILNLS